MRATLVLARWRKGVRNTRQNCELSTIVLDNETESRYENYERRGT